MVLQKLKLTIRLAYLGLECRMLVCKLGLTGESEELYKNSPLTHLE